MPQFPSRDLTNQFISTSYQDVVQQYIPTGSILYLLDGFGNVIFQIPSASYGGIVVTQDQSASYALNALSASFAPGSPSVSASYALSASYASTTTLADVALIADQALTASLADTASLSISSSYAISASCTVHANAADTASVIAITSSIASLPYQILFSYPPNGNSNTLFSDIGLGYNPATSTVGATKIIVSRLTASLGIKGNIDSASYAISSSCTVHAFNADTASSINFVPATASFAQVATSASYSPVEPSYSSSIVTQLSGKQATLVTGNTYTITSSWSNNSLTASSIDFTPTSASFALTIPQDISVNSITASVISASYITTVSPTDLWQVATKQYVDNTNPLGFDYYFRSSSADIAGYNNMLRLDTPLSASSFDLVVNAASASQYVYQFVSPAIGVTVLDTGNINTYLNAYRVGGAAANSLIPELYIRSASVETLIGTSSPMTLTTTVNSSFISTTTLTASLVVNLTDRFVCKFKVGNAVGTPNIHFTVEGQTAARIAIPIPSSNFVLRTGDTMTGNLTVPQVIGTASYALTATQAMAADFSITSGQSTSSSYASTASIALNTITATSASFSTTSSFSQVATSASYALTASTLLGSITSASFATSASYAITSSVAQTAMSMATIATDTTYYVNLTGSDSNNGVDNTSTGAWLTIQHAVDTLTQYLIPSGVTVTIQVGSGSYTLTSAVTLPDFPGAGTILIKGNEATASNVVLTTSSAITRLVYCLSFNNWIISGFQLSATANTPHGLQAVAGSLHFKNIRFGAGLNSQLKAQFAGNLQADGDYTITGGATFHYQATFGGGINVFQRTITISGGITFTTFAATTQCGILSLASNTYNSGSVTATKYTAASNSVIDTNTGGASYLPGNVAGSVSTGGQYI